LVKKGVAKKKKVVGRDLGGKKKKRETIAFKRYPGEGKAGRKLRFSKKRRCENCKIHPIPGGGRMDRA